MTGRETFQFLTYRWDVTKAWQIAAALRVHHFNAEPWFGWLALIRVDHDHLHNTDLDRPLLVVKIRELGGSALIIDGWHRLAKARHDGVTDLPVIVLDEQQEYQVRIWGGDSPTTTDPRLGNQARPLAQNWIPATRAACQPGPAARGYRAGSDVQPSSRAAPHARGVSRPMFPLSLSRPRGGVGLPCSRPEMRYADEWGNTGRGHAGPGAHARRGGAR